MAQRDAEQGAGIQSGLSSKEKIGDYKPATANEKTGKPKSAPTTSAPRGHKIK